MATMPGLRPLGFGEILDVGIKLCVRHWKPLALCVVWLVLPVQVLSVLVLLSVAPEALDPTAEQTVEPGDEASFFAGQGTVYLLQMLVYIICTAACFKAVADAYLGSQPAAGRSLAFGARRLPKLLALYLLLMLGLVLVGGAVALLGVALGPAVAVTLVLALIVPAIWLGIAWSLATPALLFEEAGPVRALGRSFTLVRGRWWRIFAVLMVAILLVSIVAGVIQGVLVLVPALAAEGNEVVLAFATVVAGTVGSTLTTPFSAAIFALVYFDQRVRKEGFDLELLAQGLGEATPTAAPAESLRPQEYTPEQRAQAPFWPPPPGWKPPEPEPVPEPEPQPSQPPAPPGGWQPPSPPAWPPESPDRGPGGL